EPIVADAGLIYRMQQGPRIVRLGDSEIGQVEGGVVAAGGADRAAVALLERQAVPTIAARLARLRYRAEAPGLGARLDIERHDEIASRHAAGGPLHHFALGHQRATGHAHL